MICHACDGEGRIPVGEFGVDCAAMHNGGRVPDPPGWEECEACDGRGRDLPRIEVTYAALGMWTAVFPDEYDGAPDGHELLGVGSSRDAAMDALIEMALDSGRIDETEAAMVRAHQVRT